MKRSRATIGSVVLAVVLAACGSGEDGTARDFSVTRDTVGDTIVVRTEAGSIWGDARLVEELRIGQLDGPDEYTFGLVSAIATGPDGTLYVLDERPPALRAYGPDGTFLRKLAGEGEGPGELGNPDGGLAFRPDGRLLVRDPGNARITVFGPDGEHETQWRIDGSFATSEPLHVDRSGNTYVQTMDFRDDGAHFAFVRYGPDGEPGDTLQVPEGDTPQLVAVRETEGGTSRSSRQVPFWPDLAVTVAPEGGFAVGRSGDYSIDIPRDDGVLRVERAYEPVPVLDAERENIRARIEHGMRNTEPGWDWDGPPIPETKPAFRRIMFDDDGRLWTYLYARAEPIPEEEIESPERGEDAPPPPRWREPVVLDAFDVDGGYLGRIEAPRRFASSVRPATAGDTMWAVVRDELDVPYVVRYRIVPETARP